MIEQHVESPQPRRAQHPRSTQTLAHLHAQARKETWVSYAPTIHTFNKPTSAVFFLSLNDPPSSFTAEAYTLSTNHHLKVVKWVVSFS